MVSYLNTVPFVYGIRCSDIRGVRLLLSPPAGCARAFAEGEADVALVPVGALSSLTDYDVLPHWCIGADGAVRTVVMVSDSPLSEIRRVFLDSHSMTSVRLARVLADNYWHISPEYSDIDLASQKPSFPPAPENAYVLIGDKVFDYEGRFRYSWDLASEWQAYSGLPMVFAVWIARKGVSNEVLASLDGALTLGVERVYEAVEGDEQKYEYLTRNIDYFFDAPKRRALDKFLSLTSKPAAL